MYNLIYEKIRNQDEWEALADNKMLREWELIITNMVRNSENKRINIPGYCTVCDKNVEFELNNKYSGKMLNFRESLICPTCHLNNRQRALVSLIKNEISISSYIYVCEQTTSAYRHMKNFFPNLIGSEFLGYDYASGKILENGIRNENAENLSFNDNSFDCVISQDVYEHVSDINAALKEAFRVIKKEGKIYISIPFHSKTIKSVRRALINNGKIDYLKEPEYHGNPIDPSKGSLVFFDYGWDFLSMLKNAGFDDVYMIKTYSPITGNVSPGGIYFIVAEKN